MVGSGPGGLSDTSRRDIPGEFGLAASRLDVDRACLGLDQYENNFGLCLLFSRNSDGAV